MTPYEEVSRTPSESELRQMEYRNNVLQAENNMLRRQLRKSLLHKENKKLKERIRRLEIRDRCNKQSKQVKRRTVFVYDVYECKNHVFTGTVRECVEHFGVSRKTIYYWRDHPSKMSAVVSGEKKLEGYQKGKTDNA